MSWGQTVISVPIRHIESSRDLILRNHAMVTATRHLVARNRRRLNPWWGGSGSSDEQDPVDELRSSVRQRLARGDLVPAPRRVWAGRGTGQRCVVCAREILASEVENEISVRAEGLEMRLYAHLPCLRGWRDESDALEHGTSELLGDFGRGGTP